MCDHQLDGCGQLLDCGEFSLRGGSASDNVGSPSGLGDGAGEAFQPHHKLEAHECPDCGEAFEGFDSASGKCAHCAQIAVLVATRGPDSPPLCLAKGSNDWSVLKQALETLRLEGTEVSYMGLHSRFSVLKTVLVKPSRSSRSSAASSAAASSAPPGGIPGVVDAAFITPKKETLAGEQALRMRAMREVAGQSGPTEESPRTATAAALRTSPNTPGGRSSAPSASRRNSVLATSPTIKDEQIGDETALVDTGVARLHPCSLGAPLPKGELGVALTKIRRTVNEYVCKMGSVDWYLEFKGPTVRALERRLEKREEDVMSSMHVDMIAGYQQLRARVASLIALYKALSAWATNDTDKNLLPALQAAQTLSPVLAAYGADWACDLQIMLARARFHSIFMQTGSVTKVAYFLGSGDLRGLLASGLIGAPRMHHMTS